MNNIIISNKKPIVIGRQGENNVTTIRFSIDALFPHIQNATYGLLHQRHGDAAPYPVATMAIGGYVNWVINSADVGKVGNGTAQLTAYKDGAVAKSIIFTTITLTSMGTTDAPDPVQIYIDRIVRAGQEAVNAAADAEESAEEAAGSAEAAAGSAEEAASSAEAAAGSAEAAAGSASDAATSATQAGLRANSAEASRNQALTYANDAYNSATQAGTHAQSAAQARTAAQQSASSAQSAASSAQQILSNISSTVEAELTEAKESGEFDGPGLYGGYSTPILNIIGSTVTYHYGVRKTDFPDLKTGDFVLGRYINAGVISYNILKIESYDSTFDLWAGSKLIPVSGRDGEDGYSPTVTVTDITGGHRVTITDASGDHTFDVMDGEDGSGGSSITVDSALSDSSPNPVQNKVVKKALDGKGTYTKPSTGIPKSDLAAAVQESLGKADTALQSVPSTYRTAAAQDTIDAGKIDKNQGSANAGKFLGIGNDGIVVPVAAPSGGSEWELVMDFTTEEEVSSVSVSFDSTVRDKILAANEISFVSYFVSTTDSTITAKGAFTQRICSGDTWKIFLRPDNNSRDIVPASGQANNLYRIVHEQKCAPFGWFPGDDGTEPYLRHSGYTNSVNPSISTSTGWSFDMSFAEYAQEIDNANFSTNTKFGVGTSFRIYVR